jgi:putative ATP-dependent endonuclease of the OLD family
VPYELDFPTRQSFRRITAEWVNGHRAPEIQDPTRRLPMKCTLLHIQNFRSIVDSGAIPVPPLLALVGANNAGKSNILRALDAFLTAGAGGVTEAAFYEKSKPVVIEATFSELTPDEQREFKQYLFKRQLVLRKEISLEMDAKSGKVKVSAEYHGYFSKPKDWWLSADAVIAKEGQRPKWEKVAQDHGILAEVTGADEKVNKKSYEDGVQKLISNRNDIEFEEPVLGVTQTLGLQTNLLSRLPSFYLLPATADYSDEIERRSTTSVFRRLMAELAERLLKTDARFPKVENALKTIRELFNETPPAASGADGAKTMPEERLKVLGEIEGRLKDQVKRLMPSVQRVCLTVVLEEMKDFFSRGVTIKVDDGILNDVLDKGHGLQRAIIFSLLQALIKNDAGKLLPGQTPPSSGAPSIILAIEEPELYIHPQLQRLIYRVLREFASSDQVIYSTHAPAFVDVWNYQNAAVVRKDNVALGTKVHHCPSGVLGSESDHKGFQLLNSFSLETNRLFFAEKCVLVEGEQDEIGIIATGRKLGVFKEFPEEIGFTIVVTGSKDEIPKFQKLLNAFKLPYVVWHEKDGRPDTDPRNKAIVDLLNANKRVELPDTLEILAGHTGHFHPTYAAKVFVGNPANINAAMETKVAGLFI